MTNTNVREVYESPEMELVVFEAEDIITTSSIIATKDAKTNATDTIVW